MCLTFQMMTLEKYLTKNDHPSTADDPTFLLQNPFLLKKCGCLQKTRAQSVRIKKKNIFKNFHFHPANEKHRKSVGF